jgi:3D (Asp-Asp-Asp) domain-containing protein
LAALLGLGAAPAAPAVASPASLALVPPAPDLAPESLMDISVHKNISAVQIYRGGGYRLVRTLTLRVTAYAPDPRCTFPFDGKTTASGLPVTTNSGRLAAADTSLIPLHSLVIVPGYARGAAVPVLDRGGAIKGRRLDVLLPTYEKAKSWGVRILEVKIYAPI